MHVLNTVHAALRADGVILDVRPAPEHPRIEIQRGAAVACIGQLDDSYRHRTLAIADTALQPFVRAHRLVRERETTFTFLCHFDSVDTWLAFMAEHWHTARIPADLIARARETCVPGSSGLRIPRIICAARFRRRCGASSHWSR